MLTRTRYTSLLLYACYAVYIDDQFRNSLKPTVHRYTVAREKQTKAKSAWMEDHKKTILCTSVPGRKGAVPASCGLSSRTLCKPTNTRIICMLLAPEKQENNKKVYVWVHKNNAQLKKNKNKIQKWKRNKTCAQDAGSFPSEQVCFLLARSFL